MIGVLFLGLLVTALPFLVGVTVAVVIAPFYWAYRLIRFLAHVLFEIGRGLLFAVRTMRRVQVTANPPAPSNVILFRKRHV
jgi:hypothetical protein